MGKLNLVVAGNHQQFVHWLKVSKREGIIDETEDYQYINNVGQLMGRNYRNTEIIFVGIYWLNPIVSYARDVQEVWDNAKKRDRKEAI